MNQNPKRENIPQINCIPLIIQIFEDTVLNLTAKIKFLVN